MLLRPGPARQWLLQLGGRVLPFVLCAAYAALLASQGGSSAGGDFNSLAGVARLFSVPGVLLAGWVHYLAFDLWVGRWIVDDLLAADRSRWWLLPTLPLTFMFGPCGLLLYLLLRKLRRPSVAPA